MRVLLILTAALGLTACEGWSKFSDEPEGDTDRKTAARLEAEQHNRMVDEESDDRAAADLLNLGMAATEQGAAGDLASPEPRRPRGQQTCAGMNDAEAFVRCLYEGVGGGWLTSGEAPDGPEVLTDRYWRTVQQMRAAGPGWARIDPLCVCDTPGSVRLTSVRIANPGATEITAEVVLAGSSSPNARLSLVKEGAAGWQVADVALHSGA